MNKHYIAILFSIVIAANAIQPLQALTIGASAALGSGEMAWYSENIMRRQIHDKNYAYTFNAGGGLVIDNPTQYQIYTNRMNISLDYYTLKFGSTRKLSRFNIDNTFCFSLLTRDYLNLWLGPQVGVHYIFGNSRYDMYDEHYSNLGFVLMEPLLGYMFKTWYNDAKYNMGSLHLGLVLGLNIITKKNIIISLSGGVKYTATAGGIAFKQGGLFQKNYIMYGHGFERFVDVALLYRFDEPKSMEKL